MSTITFPKYLATEPYRKITINVVRSRAYSDAVQGAATAAWNLAKDATENYSSLGNNTTSSSQGDGTIASYVLPIPNEFNDAQQHDWNTAKGLVGTFAEGVEQQGISQAAGGKIAGAVATGSEIIPVVGAGISAASGMPVGQLIGSMASAAGMRKPLGDPGYFQNYTGSQPRTFTMTFDLVPNNGEEALDMLKIVQGLKRYSAPQTTVEGVSILAPNYFDIIVGNPYINDMVAMHGVVIQNIAVNYSADGGMQMTPDGVPKYMQLGLTLVERKMKTQKDFGGITRYGDPAGTFGD